MTNAAPQRVVREIPATKPDAVDRLRSSAEQLRVVAYCRVSTQQEEQLNSYETQVRHYTEAINAEPNWRFAGIYADKGISGTSVKKRDEFNRMIRACKRGTVDLILTKSISRFARNTVDCLKYVRLLRDLNVDVYFEEQGIHSNQPGAEFFTAVSRRVNRRTSAPMSASERTGVPKTEMSPSLTPPSSVTEKARTESRRLRNPKRRSFAASMRSIFKETASKGLPNS